MGESPPPVTWLRWADGKEVSDGRITSDGPERRGAAARRRDRAGGAGAAGRGRRRRPAHTRTTGTGQVRRPVPPRRRRADPPAGWPRSGPAEEQPGATEG